MASVRALAEHPPAARGTAEDQVRELREYLYRTMEEAAFLLTHLDAANFSRKGMEALAEAAGGSVKGQVLTAETLAEALYAGFGITADLSVRRLRTDWQRAENFLREDRSDLTYIDIHDDAIALITERVTTPARTTQLQREGAPLWWTDRTKTKMGTEKTAWPVTVYEYGEVCRSEIRMENGALTLQRGDAEVRMEEYVDAKHRRLAYCAVDRREGTVEYRVEGDDSSFLLNMTEEENAVTFTWPDGHSCEVKLL